MENYFYISIVISLVVLALITYGKGTSNANYYLSLLGITSWFIPYATLAELIPEEALIEPVVVAFSTLSFASAVNSDQLSNFTLDVWLKQALLVLMGTGVLLFIKKAITFITWRNTILNDPSLTKLDDLSSKHQLPIYAVDKVSSGLLLGIVNPVILISTCITDPKHTGLIIAHEKQHFTNKDNLRLLFLAMAECLFWWNPLVRKLITLNRFFIEARCDQTASKSYGNNAYIEDLASLILTKLQRKPSNFVCSASSNNTNNIARIKLLKEKRTMTLRKKISYTLIALTTITAMSWNTLATATNTEKYQHVKAEQKQLGALVDFDVIITNNKKGIEEDTYRYEMIFWVNFEEKAAFEIGEDFTVNFKAKDLGGSVSLEYELIESIQSKGKIVSKPRLSVDYGEEATIEIDNSDISQYAYLIKAIPQKAVNPSSKPK